MTISEQRPELFEQSDRIWTDPHIRAQLLQEHLNPRSDAASRRQESILRLVDFIGQHLRPGSRLLDLGCGPGLYTSLLAERHIDVTGIDINEASIEYAREKQPGLRYLLGDYLVDYPRGTYDAVIMIYCDMGTHSDDDRTRLLRRIHASLAEGGLLIFDVFPDDIAREREEGKSWDYAPQGGFWHAGEYLHLSQTFHDRQHKVFACRHHVLHDGVVKKYILWERYFSEEEIRGILANAGFGRITIHKNLLGENNFTSNCEMFVVAEK